MSSSMSSMFKESVQKYKKIFKLRTEEAKKKND